VTDEQRRRSGKDPATLRAKFWRAAGGVASQSQNPAAMLLRRALPAARQNLAHSFPIYEMGMGFKSSPIGARGWRNGGTR